MRSLSLEPERISALILTCALWVLALPISGAVRAQSHLFPPWWTVAVLGGAIGCALASAVCFVRRKDPAPVARMLVAVVCGGLLSLIWVPYQPIGEAPWLAALVPTAAGACALVSRNLRRVLAAGCLVLGAQAAAESAHVWPVSSTRLVVDTLYGAAVLAIVVVVVLAARDAHHVLLEEQERAIALFADARTLEGSMRTTTRWDSLVHDEVLAALSVIAGADDALQAQRVSRRAVDRVRAAVSGSHAPTLREALLEATIDTYPLATTDLVVNPGATEPPAAVVSALADACAEALRNVVRHGYPPSTPGPATVRLRQDEASVHVDVEDYGVGFDPAAVGPHALGIAVAVEQRMASVGGRATVLSSPGAGTRVTVSWPERRG